MICTNTTAQKKIKKVFAFFLIFSMVTGLYTLIPLFRPYFLSNNSWLEKTHDIAFISSIFVGLICFYWFSILGPDTTQIETSNISDNLKKTYLDQIYKRKEYPIRYLFFSVFGAGMFAWINYTNITTAIPMISTWFVSGETQMVVTVAHPEKFISNKSCRRAINIKRKYEGRICGVPHDFRKTLIDGDELILFGKGNSLGIFYRSFQKS